MKVAIYTIALNEEQFVERWYESAKEADYLLIADTGSTDGTVALAKSLGINVVEISIRPWRFDDARNAAMALLPIDIDYCISLDMDEIITPNWRAPLEEAFNAGITRPKYKHIWSWTADGKPGLEFRYDHIHSRKGYRWKHPVHECLYPYGMEEVDEFVLGVETHHHPDDTKSRAQYLPLLEMAVKEDTQNDRNTFYYARELYFHGQYQKSTDEFKRHLKLPTATWKPERAASMRYIARMDDEFETSEWWLKQAIAEAPDRREAYVEMAKLCYEKEMWSECLDAAERAIAITEKPLEYLCEEFAWGFGPYDYAAIASYNLGFTDLALKYGMEAVDLNPTDERLQRNLMFYKA
jgi:glycosyltransferase involved in cell wall biosynthesis